MKLSAWAKLQGITYQTAWSMYKSGKLKNAYQLPTGTIIIQEEHDPKKNDYTIIYTRVSSSENRENLENQAKRLTDFCIASGYKVDEVIKEVASGLNDRRPKLHSIFDNDKVTRLVVEHSDRLTRFGISYIKKILEMKKVELIIINEPTNDTTDLIQDFVSLVTSFCARLYGLRRSKRNTEKLISALKNNK